VARRSATGTRPSRAGQRVFAAMAASGDLARHLRRLRRELVVRRAEVVAAVAAGGAEVQGDPAGAHVVVPLADRAAEEAAIGAAAAHRVLLDGLARHRTGPAPDGDGGLVIGFAAPTRAELLRALPVLRDVLGQAAPFRR
jgi:DNA-binding transcriptional MocR family regulator